MTAPNGPSDEMLDERLMKMGKRVVDIALRDMRGIIAATAAVAGMAAAIMGAGVAHADDTAYLDAVGPGMYGPAAQLGLGRYACDQMHGGVAPQDVRGPAPWTPIGPEIVAAAQRELCPDTLPRQ